MLTPLKLRRRLATGSDEGTTLVEMIVVVIIFGVIGTMLSAWFVAGYRASAGSTARNDDVYAARKAMQRLSRDLQLAVPDPVKATTTGPISAGSDDLITFYTKTTGTDTPAKVTWFVSDPTWNSAGVAPVTNTGNYNGTLNRWYYAPTGSGTSVTYPAANAPTIKQELVRGIDDKQDGKIPDIFRFIDAANAADSQLCADSATPTSCAATTATLIAQPLTSTTAPNVEAVEVYLQIVSKGDGKSGTTAPYYETSPQARIPLVLRGRVFPLSNTVSSTGT